MSRIDDILKRLADFDWHKLTEPIKDADLQRFDDYCTLRYYEDPKDYLILVGYFGHLVYGEYCDLDDAEHGILVFRRDFECGEYDENLWSVSFMEMRTTLCLAEIKLIEELLEELEKEKMV